MNTEAAQGTKSHHCKSDRHLGTMSLQADYWHYVINHFSYHTDILALLLCMAPLGPFLALCTCLQKYTCISLQIFLMHIFLHHGKKITFTGNTN